MTPYYHILMKVSDRDYNQPTTLSKNIKKLVIDLCPISNFNQPIVLSKNLVILRVGALFNQTLNLTKGIKIFLIGIYTLLRTYNTCTNKFAQTFAPYCVKRLFLLFYCFK